jgi:hypothetical protein
MAHSAWTTAELRRHATMFFQAGAYDASSAEPIWAPALTSRQQAGPHADGEQPPG